MTKAATLRYLSTFATTFVVDEFEVFDLATWQARSHELLQHLARRWPELGDLVVVRSSAINEDGPVASMAGMYHSVLGVDARSESALRMAIEKVITSYEARVDFNPRNEIIIHRQVLEPAIAGVVMTRDPRSGAPYYVVEYDHRTGRTDTVTGGQDAARLRVVRGKELEAPAPWQRLFVAVREIENHFSPGPLEVEFAITATGTVHVFQTRPLVGVPAATASADHATQRHIATIRKQVVELAAHPAYRGAAPIFSDMADWNPSEILGPEPRRLAYSLYRSLITRSTWREARSDLGYADAGPRELMVRLGAMAYIDVHASLSSLVPASIPCGLQHRLVAASLDHLRAAPELHDGIEFHVAYSSLDPCIPRRTQGLLERGLSRVEVAEVDVGLRQLTAGLFEHSIGRRASDLTLCGRLAAKEPGASDDEADLHTRARRIAASVDACRTLGALPFARLARQSFVGEEMLRRLVAAGALRPDEQDRVLASVPTIAGRIRAGLRAVSSGRSSQDQFLLEFGHLRPGTYDITSMRYDARPNLLFEGGLDSVYAADLEEVHRPAVLAPVTLERISGQLAEAGLLVNAATFLRFVVDAAAARDQSKFLFTRVLSDLLEAIARLGDRLGLSRDDLSYLDLDEILALSVGSAVVPPGAVWHEMIAIERETHAAMSAVAMPAVLTRPDDVVFVTTCAPRPDFVTTLTVEAPTSIIDRAVHSYPDVRGRIAIVEAADPGYDWLLARGIAGLVTRFGGVSSHMAVRCQELKIPAAIGCGDALFERLCRAPVIRIDGAAKRVSIVID